VQAGAVPWDEVEELVRSGEVKASLADAFEDLPVGPTPRVDDVVTMELRAVRAELDDLRRRTVKGRVRSSLRAGWPMVRRARDRWPGSPISNGADRLNDYVRTKL
jgi:hypothetical protein